MSTARGLRLELVRATRARTPARSRMTHWAAAALGRRGTGREIAVRVVAPRESRKLNKQWRGKDKPTNVLSFPGNNGYAGDIAIAYGIASKEAKAAAKSLADHATHLVVHGVLHLAGYDHERPKDASVMEPLEVKVLKRLGVADPYAARA